MIENVSTTTDRERKAQAMHDAVTCAPDVWYRLGDFEREEWAVTVDEYERLLAATGTHAAHRRDER